MANRVQPVVDLNELGRRKIDILKALRDEVMALGQRRAAASGRRMDEVIEREALRDLALSSRILVAHDRSGDVGLAQISFWEGLPNALRTGATPREVDPSALVLSAEGYFGENARRQYVRAITGLIADMGRLLDDLEPAPHLVGAYTAMADATLLAATHLQMRAYAPDAAHYRDLARQLAVANENDAEAQFEEVDDQEDLALAEP